MDEIEIEVFRADTRASRGITADDIAAVASFDCNANPVGCVVGHPKSDTPTDGVIKGFRVEGPSLWAKLSNITDNLIDGIKSKRLINRSMAFFSPDHPANPTPGKLAPRHLGFLGAAAPGIPGMHALSDAFSFSADGDLIIEGEPAEAIIFTAPATPVITLQEERPAMTEEEKAALAAREAKAAEAEKAIEAERARLAADRAEFAAQAETSRKAANKARVSSLVTAGKVLPANSAALEMVFNALDDGQLEFAADDKGSAADKLVAILSEGPAVAPKTGERLSPTGEKLTFEATGDTAKDARSIDVAARELMDADKSLSFEAAIALASGQE